MVKDSRVKTRLAAQGGIGQSMGRLEEDLRKKKVEGMALEKVSEQPIEKNWGRPKGGDHEKDHEGEIGEGKKRKK